MGMYNGLMKPTLPHNPLFRRTCRGACWAAEVAGSADAVRALCALCPLPASLPLSPLQELLLSEMTLGLPCLFPETACPFSEAVAEVAGGRRRLAAGAAGRLAVGSSASACA